MADIKEVIRKEASASRYETIKLRRHFHKYPELSFKEKDTASFICKWLDDKGIEYRKDIAGTGIIATITGKSNDGLTIAVRAELDALPVSEQNEFEYKSINDGIMHACGHDAHMAMLLSTASLMKNISTDFEGRLLLIFQPGEEKSPGGARLLIESGALNDPCPDIIISQHNLPELAKGKAGFKSGRYMASCDELYFTIRGKGGHAAIPHKVVDPVLIAAHIITALQQVVSRNAQPTTPSVLSAQSRPAQ